MSAVIRIENLGKRYRLGDIDRRMLYEDLQRRWAKLAAQAKSRMRIVIRGALAVAICALLACGADSSGTLRPQLGTVRAHVGSVATRRDPFVVALDEAELELDAAQEEFAAMTEAQVLLAQLAPKLDEPGRVTLALAVGLLCQIDGATRADALAYEVDRLRGLRLKMVGGAN